MSKQNGPWYGCENRICVEECSYPADMLRMLHGKVICEGCYYDDLSIVPLAKTYDDNGDVDEVVDWHDLPPFVPEETAELAKLRAENERLRETVMLVATANYHDSRDQLIRWAEMALQEKDDG